MEFAQFKEFIEKIKDNEKFKEVLEFTRLMELNPDGDLYKNLDKYLRKYYYRVDCKEWFQPDYKRFVEFLEHYLKNQPSKDIFDERGYLDLSKTPYLIKPLCFVIGAGRFTDNHIMLTDGTKYISKIPLNIGPTGAGVGNKYCIYCSLIASYIAKAIGVEAARYILATKHNGNNILSENFLKPNEELVEYFEYAGAGINISEQLSKLEEALRLRKFTTAEIEKAKDEFIKQEFVAKVVGLKDQDPGNSPIMISVDEDGTKHVKMPPMFDLDFSFHIGEEKKEECLTTRKCDNGQTDIGSFIEQYKDWPGFKEFAKKSIQALDMRQIFAQIYSETGIKIFGDYENDEQMNKFINFVERNLQLARDAIGKVYGQESGERE